jgi:hypothetical protein
MGVFPEKGNLITTRESRCQGRTGTNANRMGLLVDVGPRREVMRVCVCACVCVCVVAKERECDEEDIR